MRNRRRGMKRKLITGIACDTSNFPGYVGSSVAPLIRGAQSVYRRAVCRRNRVGASGAGDDGGA